MTKKPDIILQMEEKLGFPLKELDSSEILPPPRNEAGITRGYALTNEGEITGLRLEFSYLAEILSLFNKITTLTFINLSCSWPLPDTFLQQDVFHNLTGINLYRTQLKNYTFLKELKGLTSLYLSSNNLTDVTFLKELKGLTSLDLSRNPIENPPKEIIDRGIDSIRDYFKSLERKEEKKDLEEIKILLVGEGEAGKTSLMKRIEGKAFDSQEGKTQGITIKDIPFPIHRKNLSHQDIRCKYINTL